MNINFYLANEDQQTQIALMYDVPCNPFKVGDEIYLEVRDLCVSDYFKYSDKYANTISAQNKELEQKFNRKKIIIVREGKYMSFKITQEPKLTIEYHCIFVED